LSGSSSALSSSDAPLRWNTSSPSSLRGVLAPEGSSAGSMKNFPKEFANRAGVVALPSPGTKRCADPGGLAAAECPASGFAGEVPRISDWPALGIVWRKQFPLGTGEVEKIEEGFATDVGEAATGTRPPASAPLAALSGEVLRMDTRDGEEAVLFDGVGRTASSAWSAPTRIFSAGPSTFEGLAAMA